MPSSVPLATLLWRKCTCIQINCFQQFSEAAAEVQRERDRFKSLDADDKDFLGKSASPYVRSRPLFQTCLKDLFHISVLHMYISLSLSLSLPLYIYIHYIYLDMCNLILHLHARTWMHIHTGEHTCTNTFTMSKPRDCVGNPVPAALTAATHLTMTVLCHGRVVLGCCPSWQSKWQICLHRLQLLSAVVQLCCVMVGMRLAAASCQSKNCLLRYSCTNFDKDVLRSCAGLGQFVPDPVPYRSIPVPDPDQPCTTPQPPRGEWEIHCDLLT